jgi:hypothetical protein
MTTNNPFASSSTIMKDERHFLEERYPHLNFRDAPQFRDSFFKRPVAYVDPRLALKELEAKLEEISKQVDLYHSERNH